MATCSAKSKQSGQRCRSAPVPGRTVCRMHGGATPRGVALPQTTHGRHSKALPGRLLERYQAALQDGELLALREEVALVDARLLDVLGRVESGESGAVWRALKAALTAYLKARAQGNAGAQATTLAELQDLIARGSADAAAWAEVRALVHDRRKLVESEQKQQLTAQQTLSVQEAMTLLAAVSDTIRRHVTDPTTLGAIAADLGQLVAHRAGEQPSPN